MCRTDLQNGDFEGTTLGVLSETLLHQPKKKNPQKAFLQISLAQFNIFLYLCRLK